MRPRWQKIRWAGRLERQRSAFVAELERQGEHKLALRAGACCRFVAISALECCASEQRLRWNVCGIRGCPVCAHVHAKREAQTLWDYARHLNATTDGCASWRHVVLTSPRLDHTTVTELFARSRSLKRASKQLWAAMKTWKEPPLGMRCYLEAGSSGMVHIHALVLGRWIDAGWLKRTWAELTGWGYHDAENNEQRAVCGVYALYRYRSASDRSEGKKTYGATRAAFKEFGKYIASPKAGPELGARFGLALKDAPRSWGYGCFVGLRKARKAGELLEGSPAGTRLQPGREPVAICPHCGCVHPARRCTPFVDLQTGALAFGQMRPVLELLETFGARQRRA